MNELEYIELIPHAKSAFEGERSWREVAYKTWRCRCSRPKLACNGPIDVVVKNTKRKMLVDFVFGFSGFAIVAASLVEQLGQRSVQSLFHVGKVITADKRLVETYVTLRTSASPVYIRGDDKNSIRRLCPECGRIILVASGKPYLCDVQQPEAMLQSEFGHLLLRKDYFRSTLGDAKLPKTKQRCLPVRDIAADGLPSSIDQATQIIAQIEKDRSVADDE